jgi:hypothetical protein
MRIFLRIFPERRIDDPLTIFFVAAPVLGRANDSWSATGGAGVVVLLFGAVVASTSFLAFPNITAFAGSGAILILALNLLWTTL